MRLLIPSILTLALLGFNAEGAKYKQGGKTNKIKVVWACFDHHVGVNSTRRLLAEDDSDYCMATMRPKKVVYEVMHGSANTWLTTTSMKKCKFKEVARQYEAMGMHPCATGTEELACDDLYHMEFRTFKRLSQMTEQEELYICKNGTDIIAKWGSMCGNYEHSIMAFMTTLSCVAPDFTKHCPFSFDGVFDTEVPP